MLKIIKNNTKIGVLKGHKYIFKTKVDGKDMYAPIGLKPLIGIIAAKFKLKKIMICSSKVEVLA